MFWAVTTRHSKDNSQKKRRFCAFSFLCQKEGPACGIPQAGPYHCEQNCKPGSVFDSHLSRRTVAGTLKPPREQPGQPLCSHTGVAPDRVYSDGQFPAVGCALTAPFHPYWQAPASASHLPAVYLCCTFPEVAFGGRYPLSLPYGARTFLMKRPFGQTTRLSVFLAGLLYRKEKKLSTFFQKDFKRSYNFIFCCYRQITI